MTPAIPVHICNLRPHLRRSTAAAHRPTPTLAKDIS